MPVFTKSRFFPLKLPFVSPQHHHFYRFTASTMSSPPNLPGPSSPSHTTAVDDERLALQALALAPSADSDDHDDSDDDPPPSSPHVPDISDTPCVICFARPPNCKLEPCGHANICDVCVSRLVKRRCPTCRARARKVVITTPTGTVVKAVREVIAERKMREAKVLEETLQVVFLGPAKVGKKTLVRKMIERFPTAISLNEGEEQPDPSELDVFSDGTDFSANCTIGETSVRLTVLRRTNLTSRRMVLDDVRVLKPDVLVLCCSAHLPETFDTIMSWDKVLRNNFQKPRVWALLTLDDLNASAAVKFDTHHDVAGAINAIIPTDLRPKGHYLCSPGEHFSIGFRSLAKDIVSLGRMARDEELAATLALEEARSMADHEAAGTIADHDAANLVIANNGIGVPSNPQTANGQSSRNNTSGGRQGTGRTFSLRAFRERNSHHNNHGGSQGVSILSGVVNWLTGAGSHE